MHIKNQFLRWFVYYFNICSVPLLPVCFRFGHHGQGRLLFTWNLFAIATSLYFIFAIMTPQALQAIRRRGDALFGNSSQKPLFTLFFRLGVTFALPMGFFSNYLYFSKLCLAPKSSSRSTAYLFSLLDRPNVTIPRRVFFILLAVDHFVFIFTYNITFKMLFALQLQLADVPKIAGAYFAFYRLNGCSMTIFGLVAYHKYTVLVELTNILRISVAADNCDGVSAKIQFQVINLASTSRQVNRIFSFPLLSIIFAQVYNAVILLARILISNHFHFGNLLYIVFFLSWLLLLAVLQHLIDRRLEDIERALVNRKAIHWTSANNKMSLNQKRKISGHYINNGSLVYRLQKQHFANSNYLQAVTMTEVYRKCFQTRLFNLCHLNGQFIRLMVLFVVNYIVLITQTSL